MKNRFRVFDGISAAAPIELAPQRERRSPAEQLYRDVETQREREAALLRETANAAGLAATPLAKFAVDQVEDSVRKQLRLLERMGASLSDALHWTFSPQALPSLTTQRERAAAIESLTRLLVKERASARATRRLAASYARIEGGLERALLEASAASSDSNARLLELVLNRLAASAEDETPANTRWTPALRERAISVREAAEQTADDPAAAAA